MSEDHKNNIQENVLAAIQAGKVHMRPKWHFVLKTILVFVGLFLVLIATLFIGSLLLFILHQNGAWFAPVFGTSGIRELFTALPVLFVLVAIIFIILLQLLIRRYSFSYGRPAMYTVLGAIILVVGGSLIIQQTGLHEGLLEEAREQRLPFGNRLYYKFGGADNLRLTPGVIVENTGTGFMMRDPSQQIYRVIITSGTKLPLGANFDVRDRVVVLGEKEGDFIEAEGVRELGPKERFMPPREMK